MLKSAAPILALLFIYHISFISGARHYIIDYPRRDLNSLNASCYGTASVCSKGWFKANTSWILCGSTSTTLQSMFYLVTQKVDIPGGLPLPVRIRISVSMNIMKCHGNANICSQRLVMMVNFIKESKVRETPERFELYATHAQSGSYNIQSRFIEDSSGIKSIRLEFSSISSGFCGAIRDVHVFFEYCPSDTRNLVHYPNISAETNGEGSCLRNSTAPSGTPLTRHCNATAGVKDDGFCVCVRGMMKRNNYCQGKKF